MKRLLLTIIIILLSIQPVQAQLIAKGLAQATDHPEDRAALGVSWWYVWGWCDEPGCIPMSRDGSLPQSCPSGGFALWLNEPNADEPYGYPMTPYLAARSVRAMEQMCPTTRLIVGNVSADDWGKGSGYQWLKAFLYEYKRYTRHYFTQILGMHCYTLHLASYCTSQLAYMSTLYSGEKWVTEFNVWDGDTAEFTTLLDYIISHFTRFSAYTNRQPPPPCGWCGPSTLDLVRPDGTLTQNGIAYSQK